MVPRAYPRVSLRAEASIRYGTSNYAGMLANLSLNGVFITTETRIPVGDSAELAFRDAFPHGMAAVRASGTVVRNDDNGVAFILRQMDVDSFINLHLIMARRAATD